jgi:hypothetical protein
VLLASAMILAGQLVGFADYFTDDSYIYARFASNLVENGEFAFNPAEHIHAATSPLWALLVAGLIALGVPVVAGTKILGAACAIGALMVSERIAHRRFGGGVWYALCLMLVATEPWFVRWSASGMETPLAVLLLVIALEAGRRSADQVAWARLGFALGLLPLVRPEGILLLGLVGLLALVDGRARRRKGFWVGAAAPLLVWSSFAVPYFGAVLPATLQAKSTPLGLVPSRFLANLITLGALYAVALALPALGWFAGLVRRPARLWTRDRQDWIAPAMWSWTIALPVVYLVRDVQVVSRYLEIVLPVVLVLGVGELTRLPRPRLWQALVAAEIAGVLLFTTLRVMPNANGFGRSLQGIVEIGEWLRTNTPSETLVAAYDIGALGYASDRRVLDLGGLVHAGINDLRNEVADSEILAEARFLDFGTPDFLVDRDPAGPVLDGRQLGQLRCEVVMTRRVDNLGLTRPEPVHYTLYRLVPLPR